MKSFWVRVRRPTHHRHGQCYHSLRNTNRLAHDAQAKAHGQAEAARLEREKRDRRAGVRLIQRTWRLYRERQRADAGQGGSSIARTPARRASMWDKIATPSSKVGVLEGLRAANDAANGNPLLLYPHPVSAQKILALPSPTISLP